MTYDNNYGKIWKVRKQLKPPSVPRRATMCHTRFCQVDPELMDLPWLQQQLARLAIETSSVARAPSWTTAVWKIMLDNVKIC